MKTTILFVMLSLITISGFSQIRTSREAMQGSDVILKDGDTTASLSLFRIIEAPELSKENLFNLTKAWLAQTFRAGEVNNNRVLDLEAGYIIEKSILGYFYEKVNRVNTMMSRCNGNIYYTIKIDFKDGRLRFSSTDYMHQSIDWNVFGKITNYDLGRITVAEIKNTEWPNYMKKCWIDAKKQITEAHVALYDSLKDYIIKSSKSDDNW